VCPTGIDIRNGTQLECVNCSACIDACDSVMDKVGFKQGLIRYTSENIIANKTKFKWTGRIIGYSVVLLLLLTTLSSLLAFRKDVEATIVRTPGLMYQKTDDGQISNLYNIQVVNKTFKTLSLEINVKHPEGKIKLVGNGFNNLNGQTMGETVFFVVLPENVVKSLKTPVVIDILSNGKVVDEVKTNFLGPNSYSY
jgi:polyferredoxin